MNYSLKFQKNGEILINMFFDGISKQLIIKCQYEKTNETNNIIRDIKSNISFLVEKFSKLNEYGKTEIRKMFKILKEMDRASLSILSQKDVEEIYFLLSLLRERICEYTKDLIEISLKTGQWLKILNNLRKELNTKLDNDIAKKLLSELSYWKEKICNRIKI